MLDFPELYCEIQWQGIASHSAASTSIIIKIALKNNGYIHQTTIPYPSHRAKFRTSLQQWPVLRHAILNCSIRLIVLIQHANYRIVGVRELSGHQLLLRSYVQEEMDHGFYGA